MKVITVTNRKGGVGKTTIASHLAAGLATKGYRVGIVDVDSQGHVALMYGLDQADDLFEIMVENKPLAQGVIRVPPEMYSTQDMPSTGELFAIRGYEQTYQIPFKIQATEIFKFVDLMRQFQEAANLDYIIVDSQPSLSQFDGSVYLATDAFLYVTDLGVLSINGLIDAIDQMQRFNKLREQYIGAATRIMGIIPNKMRANTVVDQENLRRLGEYFGVFEQRGAYNPDGLVMTPMRLLTVWNQACNERIPVFTYEPTSEAAKDIWRIVSNVEKRMTTWQASATE